MTSQPPQSDQHHSDQHSPAEEFASPEDAIAPESRADRLARIRAEIQAGTYDTEEKMDAAIDRMLGRVSWE